MFYLNNMFI